MAARNVGETIRHARMPINSAVFMMSGGESWSTDMVDISATGAMVRRPADWRGTLGERYVLDMLIGPELNIHLEAVVARITEWHVGFAYEHIPADKEASLWDLLGSYADQIEHVRG
jgi:PilZ domain